MDERQLLPEATAREQTGGRRRPVPMVRAVGNDEQAAPPITTATAVYLVLFAISGFPNVATQVGTQSTAQLLCPPEVLGRLGGLMSAASSVGMGAGSIAAGALVARFGARALLSERVLILVVCGLIAWWIVARPARSAA